MVTVARQTKRSVDQSRTHIQKMEVAEIRMLKWMCRHTRRDQIRNEDIQNKVRVASAENKISGEVKMVQAYEEKMQGYHSTKV